MRFPLRVTPPQPPAPRSAGAPGLARAIVGGAAVASILTAAVACDKRAPASERRPTVAHHTSLGGTPPVLFLVFGDKGDPRVLPVATLVGGRVTPIQLDAAGWRTFDGMYFHAGTKLPIYRDGRVSSEALVRRGMWEGTDALYKLPGCKALRPLAAATVPGSESADMPVMLEMLATNVPLAPPPARPAPAAADADSASALAARAAQHQGLTRTERGDLDIVTRAIATGATAHPTLVASYMERGGGVGGKARHLFVLGDATPSGAYATSFVHAASDTSPAFRRLVDHVDLTGDGVDEVILEAWRNDGDSYLVVLSFKNGRWLEVTRGATSWCADAPP